MIHGIFLTPEAFDELCRTFGKNDGVESLARFLFPFGSSCDNVLVVDPHSNTWWERIGAIVCRLPPQSMYKAQQIVLQIEKKRVLVSCRSNHKAPESESRWVRLVEKELADLVDLLLCSSRSGGICDRKRVFRWDEVVENEERARPFLTPQCSIPRSWDGQQPVFEKLCQLNDWCVLELPQLRGRPDRDEFVTLEQLISLASRHTQVSKASFTFDVIANGKHFSTSNQVERLRKLIQSVKTEGNRRVSVRVYLADRVLDRNLVWGVLDKPVEHRSDRIPRWLVWAQHVAIQKTKLSVNEAEDSRWGLDGPSAATSKWRAYRETIQKAGSSVVGEIVLKTSPTGHCR